MQDKKHKKFEDEFFVDDFFEKEKIESEEERLRKQEEADIDLYNEMSTEYGRRNVFRLLAEAKVFSSTFTGNSYTYYYEGKRDIGIWKLQHILRVCPEFFILMIQENYNKQLKESEVKHGDPTRQ